MFVKSSPSLLLPLIFSLGCLPTYELDSSTDLDASSEASPPVDGATTPEGGAIGVVGETCSPPNGLACAGYSQKLVLFCDPASGEWTALQTCADQQLCDSRPGPTQGSCQDPVPECIGQTPLAKVCDGSVLIACGPDLLTATRTECEQACVNGACAGACQPGIRACSGATPQHCTSDGTWQAEAPCAYVCTGAGECSGECKPGTKRCNGSVPQACTSTGEWQGGADCPGVCSGGECVASCSQGQTQCDGKVPQTCEAGSWQSGTPCPYVCDKGACVGVCTPNDKRCSSLVPQTCDAEGQWQSGTACPFVCGGGTCTGVCKPGSKDCQNLVPRSCDNNGQWQSGAACSTSCTDGVCGVCELAKITSQWTSGDDGWTYAGNWQRDSGWGQMTWKSYGSATSGFADPLLSRQADLSGCASAQLNYSASFADFDWIYTGTWTMDVLCHAGSDHWKVLYRAQYDSLGISEGWADTVVLPTECLISAARIQFLVKGSYGYNSDVIWDVNYAKLVP